MKDFFDSIRQQIGDRMGSPLFGSFAIAWLCWNHQYLVILVSDLPVTYRFTLAGEIVYAAPWGIDPRWGVLLKGIIWPGLSSLAYIIVYPHISKKLLEYWDTRQSEIENLRKTAQKKRLLTSEEGEAIILRSLEERERFAKQLAAQSAEVEAVRKASVNSATEGKLTQAVGKIAELEKALSDATRKENEETERAALEHRSRNNAEQELSLARRDLQLAQMEIEKSTKVVAEPRNRRDGKSQAPGQKFHPMLRALANKPLPETELVKILGISNLRWEVLKEEARPLVAQDVDRKGVLVCFLTDAGKKYVVDQDLDVPEAVKVIDLGSIGPNS
jgi:hypothetical protein